MPVQIWPSLGSPSTWPGWFRQRQRCYWLSFDSGCEGDMRHQLVKLAVIAAILFTACKKESPEARREADIASGSLIRLSDYLKLPRENWKDGSRERLQYTRAITDSTFAV